jgi:CarD family transcriptional regulator
MVARKGLNADDCVEKEKSGRLGQGSAAKAAPAKHGPQKAAPAKAAAAKPAPTKPTAAVKVAAPVKPVVPSKAAALPAKPVVAPKAYGIAQVETRVQGGDFVVYPTHGVGRIQKVDEQEVAGHALELFVIAFEKDKMILRVPTTKAKAVGMRKLSTPDVVATALNTLKGRARIKRTMWSRRAQEYEAKINSGDLVAIARGCSRPAPRHRPAGAIL